MINIGSWNIRGLNFSPKQNEIRHIISENNLAICAILETHVDSSNLHKICPLVFRHWDWTSNGNLCDKGTRIILRWNHNDVTVDNLMVHKHFVRDRPWCLLGDFNSALYLVDKAAGVSSIDISMREFKECVDDIVVLDVQSSGLHFTWNQKPRGKDGVLKKIDRIMANFYFNDIFVGAHAIFKPYRISDHAPLVLCIPTNAKKNPKPIKFFNILTSHDRFRGVVADIWSIRVSGFAMFKVTQKLKQLKKPFRKLLYENGNLHANAARFRDELDRIQLALDVDPFNSSLREEEAIFVDAFNEALVLQEKFLKQKAKVDWLRDGDSNTTYFHKAVKSRIIKNRIDVVTNCAGLLFENERVADAFVSHYELDTQDALYMTRAITRQEIKEALFSMGNDKAPGPDGYTSAFFKEAWDIIADDVTSAVSEFFINGRLLKELNHTIIALIPKVRYHARVNDYRPISYCNV
ncbi:RNA-directed DNA polymerase, eukaryota, reverse transcriptase zinc-binding domain protein [Tanacetum coccineum]